MKQLLSFQPIFTPGVANAGTLDFSAYPGTFNLGKLYAVIDVTNNAPIYIAGAPGLGVSAINGSVITLAFNTSSFNARDKLNVYYDTGSGYESNTVAEFGGQMQLMQETMYSVLQELRVMNIILAQGLNINDDIDGLRNDVNSVNNNPIN
jgi:hypothetical protein